MLANLTFLCARTFDLLIPPTEVLSVVDSDKSVSVTLSVLLVGASASKSIAVTTKTSRSSTFNCRSFLSEVKVLAADSVILLDITITPDVGFSPLGMNLL